MRKLTFLSALAFVAAGCSGGSDAGDVATAEKAAAAQPKTAADLPANLPDEARTQAASALGQRDAIKAQMDAQAAGMKAAQARAH